jgi:hypothetical protein
MKWFRTKHPFLCLVGQKEWKQVVPRMEYTLQMRNAPIRPNRPSGQERLANHHHTDGKQNKKSLQTPTDCANPSCPPLSFSRTSLPPATTSRCYGNPPHVRSSARKDRRERWQCWPCRWEGRWWLEAEEAVPARGGRGYDGCKRSGGSPSTGNLKVLERTQVPF